MDPISVTSGGVAQIDTELLRGASRQVLLAVGLVEDAQKQFTEATFAIERVSTVGMSAAGMTAWSKAGAVCTRGEELKSSLEFCADVYEIAEAKIQGDIAGERWPKLPDFLDPLSATDQVKVKAADELLRAWQKGGGSEVQKQFDELMQTTGNMAGSAGLPFGVLLASGALAGMRTTLKVSGSGVIAPGTVLGGPTPNVRVSVLDRTTKVSAPQTISDIVDRIPAEGDARVIVDKLEMPDGSQRFIAYVSGTRNDAEGEAWNNMGNIGMYVQGNQTPAHEAVMQALQDAGARPGDELVLGGYSQGAMTTSHIAVDSPYKVVASIDVGSSKEPILPDDVLRVSLQHRDDPAVALQSGGAGITSGSPESIIVSRVADPEARFSDLLGRAHGIDLYRQTAHDADASGSSQVAAAHEFLGGYSEGAEVTRTRYTAVLNDDEK